MNRTDIIEKQQNLERVRSERVALAAKIAGLVGEVQRAADAARTAQLDAVISPSRETQSRAEGASKALEAVVAKRDEAEDRIQLLDLAGKRLDGEIRDLDLVVRRAERAAAIVGLEKKLDELRAAGRQFIVYSVAAEMLKGTTVTDAGLCAIQMLEPKQHIGAVVNSVSATAAVVRDSIDRGEGLK